MNAINVIASYKHYGMWVFDDPRVGLVPEPFVAGADAMIDRVVADLPDAGAWLHAAAWLSATQCSIDVPR